MQEKVQLVTRHREVGMVREPVPATVGAAGTHARTRHDGWARARRSGGLATYGSQVTARAGSIYGFIGFIHGVPLAVGERGGRAQGRGRSRAKEGSREERYANTNGRIRVLSCAGVATTPTEACRRLKEGASRKP